MTAPRRTYSAFIVFLGAALGMSTIAFAAPHNTVAAQNFLGLDWMESPVHRVAPQALNNGQINTYIIDTHHGTFHVKGTDQARAFIREIDTAHKLRNKSTVGMVGSALKSRVVNLVKTPLATVKSVGNRIDTVSNVGDAVLLVPRTAIDVSGTVLNGAGEMVYTGNRLLKSASGGGKKCQGLGECLADAGKDVFSGVNSVAGKHNSSRKLHARFGTDSETRNPILKREVDRLAYAESYTKTGFKLFAPNTGFTELDTYRQGVGFYNNTELVANYEDAYRKRDKQRADLEARGIHPDVLNGFYKNKTYTKKQNFALIESLNRLGPAANLSPFIEDAGMVNTAYDAKSCVDRYAYFAKIKNTRGINDFKDGPTRALGPIAITADGHHVMPLKADFLGLTAETDKVVSRLAGFTGSELHVLGHASPELKRRAQGKGVRLVEVR